MDRRSTGSLWAHLQVNERELFPVTAEDAVSIH